MREPDCRAAVAALLAAGFPPPEIERAMIRELRRQTAGQWRRYESGTWYTQTPEEAAKHAYQEEWSRRMRELDRTLDRALESGQAALL